MGGTVPSDCADRSDVAAFNLYVNEVPVKQREDVSNRD
jgi:hypothetical protein